MKNKVCNILELDALESSLVCGGSICLVEANYYSCITGVHVGSRTIFSSFSDPIDAKSCKKDHCPVWLEIAIRASCSGNPPPPYNTRFQYYSSENSVWKGCL